MLWDESTGKWRPRWGYDRANNNEEQWILPAKPGQGVFSLFGPKKKKRVCERDLRHAFRSHGGSIPEAQG